MGRNEKVATRPDESRPRSSMKKHWLATPKPFIAWVDEQRLKGEQVEPHHL